jgi:predicted SprT family Zn-dependent metalloprotease
MNDTLTATDDSDARQPPAFDPARFDAPAYGDIETHADLIAYSRAYFAVCVAHYDADVDVSHVRAWDVSTQAKRRAAVVTAPDLSKLGVLTMAGLTSPDWEELAEEHNSKVRRARGSLADHQHVKDVTLTLTWGAFEAFGEDEWQETIRHEMVHVEQYHQHGKGGHSGDFSIRAREYDATEECPQFTDYDYPFECRECGGDAGGRYRESKAVRFARLSPEEQEEWVDAGKTYWTTECCEAFLTLAE